MKKFFNEIVADYKSVKKSIKFWNWAFIALLFSPLVFSGWELYSGIQGVIFLFMFVALMLGSMTDEFAQYEMKNNFWIWATFMPYVALFIAFWIALAYVIIVKPIMKFNKWLDKEKTPANVQEEE